MVTAASSPVFVRSYGAPMLTKTAADWGEVRATLIRRERAAEVQQRFLLPDHVFRLGVSGTFGAGSTTALGNALPVPLAQQAGTSSYYPPGTAILNEVTRASRLTYLTVEIDPGLADKLLVGEAAVRNLEPVAALEDELVTAILRTLIPVAGDAAPPPRLYAEQAALMLLLTVQRRSRANGERETRVHRGGMAAIHLQRVTDYLLDCMAKDVSLNDLAALTSLSPTHLCRAFKQSTGTTPHRWRQAARIDRAKQLLTGSLLPIAEISLAVGFSGQSQFTTAFRRETGSTPNRWRARNTE